MAVDIAAYLADPRAAHWDRFRNHFPRCAECSLAVTRGAQRNGLGVGPSDEHPAGALLIRFERDAASLEASARDEVASHLSECSLCRDSLRALARMALEAAGDTNREPVPSSESLWEDQEQQFWPQAAVHGQSSGIKETRKTTRSSAGNRDNRPDRSGPLQRYWPVLLVAVVLACGVALCTGGSAP